MNDQFDKNLCKFFTEDDISLKSLYSKKINDKFIGEYLVDLLKSKHSTEDCLDVFKKIFTTLYEFGDSKTKELINCLIQTYKQ
jgi:hypothetical protein